MSRPRIRTIKPELWRDEKVGRLSHGARLLLLGMITSADDEGRLRCLESTLLGDIFPYDRDAARRLPQWLDEVAGTGVVLLYEIDGMPYAAFRHWRRHQKVNRPRVSLLPAPPDHELVTANAVTAPGCVTEDSVNDHGNVTDRVGPPAQARGSDPDPDPESVEPEQRVETRARGRSRAVDQDALPDDFPTEQAQLAQHVLTRLDAVWQQRGGTRPALRGVGLALQAEGEDRDVDTELGKFEHYYLAGKGHNARIKDWPTALRNWLANADHARAHQPGTTPARPETPAEARHRRTAERLEFARLEREGAAA